MSVTPLNFATHRHRCAIIYYRYEK